ncbi:MAG TPA: adenylate kinase [Acidimicrobiales bacterium]|nr:adenylate kinase [Acidimicrobiales bacterium]
MNPGARIVVLGKQGAGKGTQAVRLSRHYVVPHVATGDTFRAAVRSGSEFGQKAKRYLDAGELVPDEIVIGVVKERLTRDDTTHRGFILDGFPRTVGQAEALMEFLNPKPLDVVINLDIATAEVLGRLASRRVCSDCGANYSVVDNPPRVPAICDVCGGDVVQRDDDTEIAIRRRLELYERETAPLIEWFDKRGLLATVQGSGTPDEVTQRLVAEVNRRKQRHFGQSSA